MLIKRPPFAVEGARKRPVSGKERVGNFIVHPLIILLSYEFGEGEGEIPHVAHKTGFDQARFKQAESERGALHRAERHTEKENFVHDLLGLGGDRVSLVSGGALPPGGRSASRTAALLSPTNYRSRSISELMTICDN